MYVLFLCMSAVFDPPNDFPARPPLDGSAPAPTLASSGEGQGSLQHAIHANLQRVMDIFREMFGEQWDTGADGAPPLRSILSLPPEDLHQIRDGLD